MDPAGIATPCERYLPGNCGIDDREGQVDSRGVGIAVLGPLTIDGKDSRGVRDRVVLAGQRRAPQGGGEDYVPRQ